MQRTDSENSRLYNPIIQTGLRMASRRYTATAEMPIQPSWEPVQYVTLSANTTILLPPENLSVGLTFFIRVIAGAFTLTVEEDSSTTSIGTLGNGEGMMFHCDGTTWYKFETDIV